MATSQRAQYAKTGLATYDGNPLIEALPPIWTDLEVARGMLNEPPLPQDSERLLAPKVRVHAVNRLRDVIIPLMPHIDVEDNFSQLIRGGYTSRNPFSRETVAMRHAARLEDVRWSGYCSSARDLTIIGMSGMGKTTCINSVLRMYPQVIEHKKFESKAFIQTQVVWLKLECPHDGSLRGFCSAFFQALDAALNTSEHSKILNTRANIDMLIEHIGRHCRNYCIGAVIIDELQHLNTPRSDKVQMLNLLVNLSNRAGVPFVYIGTNAMIDCLSDTLRNARRAAGMGLISFDRFEQNDENWNVLLGRLWKYNWISQATELDADFTKCIYDLTQGNVDFLVILLILTQKYAIYQEIDKISLETLQHVFDNQMYLLHRPIAALRSGDLHKFDDLMPAKDQIEAMISADIYRKANKVNRVIHLAADNNQQEKPVKAAKEKSVTTVVATQLSSTAKDLAHAEDIESAMAALNWTKS